MKGCGQVWWPQAVRWRGTEVNRKMIEIWGDTVEQDRYLVGGEGGGEWVRWALQRVLCTGAVVRF